MGDDWQRDRYDDQIQGLMRIFFFIVGMGLGGILTFVLNWFLER